MVPTESPNTVPGRSLTLRQAAGRARLSIADFRTAASSLIGTDQVLRFGGGESPERYDARSVDLWLQQQFLREDRDATRVEPGQPVVTVEASWDGEVWTLHAPELGATVSNSRLMAAQRLLATTLSTGSGTSAVDGEGMRFDIAYSTDHPAMRTWMQAEDLKRQASELLQRSSSKRFEALLEMKREGMTNPEIAAALGLTAQRIQQILTRPPSPAEDSST